MKKWELAYYIIEAKKCVDNIIFIGLNLDRMNINRRDVVQNKLRGFYLNLRIIYDYTHKTKEQRQLAKGDQLLQAILYEADKNHAHKDAEYKPKKYDSLIEQANDLIEQLEHFRAICSEDLPEILTLDFMPHDRELYRLINGITTEIEEEMKKHRHPEYGKIEGIPIEKPKKVFHSVEQSKEEMINANDYAVVLESGINAFEDIQNRQDFCVKINTLFGLEAWFCLDKGKKGMHKTN